MQHANWTKQTHFNKWLCIWQPWKWKLIHSSYRTRQQPAFTRLQFTSKFQVGMGRSSQYYCIGQYIVYRTVFKRVRKIRKSYVFSFKCVSHEIGYFGALFHLRAYTWAEQGSPHGYQILLILGNIIENFSLRPRPSTHKSIHLSTQCDGTQRKEKFPNFVWIFIDPWLEATRLCLKDDTWEKQLKEEKAPMKSSAVADYNRARSSEPRCTFPMCIHGHDNKSTNILKRFPWEKNRQTPKRTSRRWCQSQT
jgi:hypothetical protein